jgi:uncharacterized pyridoxal phosphate-containing UPF0001 family protein
MHIAEEDTKFTEKKLNSIMASSEFQEMKIHELGLMGMATFTDKQDLKKEFSQLKSILINYNYRRQKLSTRHYHGNVR